MRAPTAISQVLEYLVARNCVRFTRDIYLEPILIGLSSKTKETTMTTDPTPPVTSQQSASKPKATTQPKSEVATVTLDMLCKELKLVPREARMMLRLAVKKKGEFPNLAKDHEPRAPWQWSANSKGLAEARKALTSTI